MHITEVIDVSHCSDTQVSVRLRCCGDASTDSCHTIDTANVADADITAWLSGRHDHVKALHANRERAKSILATLGGK